MFPPYRQGMISLCASPSFPIYETEIFILWFAKHVKNYYGRTVPKTIFLFWSIRMHFPHFFFFKEHLIIAKLILTNAYLTYCFFSPTNFLMEVMILFSRIVFLIIIWIVRFKSGILNTVYCRCCFSSTGRYHYIHRGMSRSSAYNHTIPEQNLIYQYPQNSISWPPFLLSLFQDYQREMVHIKLFCNSGHYSRESVPNCLKNNILCSCSLALVDIFHAGQIQTWSSNLSVVESESRSSVLEYLSFLILYQWSNISILHWS